MPGAFQTCAAGLVLFGVNRQLSEGLLGCASWALNAYWTLLGSRPALTESSTTSTSTIWIDPCVCPVLEHSCPEIPVNGAIDRGEGFVYLLVAFVAQISVCAGILIGCYFQPRVEPPLSALRTVPASELSIEERPTPASPAPRSESAKDRGKGLRGVRGKVSSGIGI